MRRRVAILISIVTVFVYLTLAKPATVASADSPSLAIELGHHIQVRDGGLIIINDDLSITNNSTNRDVSNLLVGFPKDLSGNLDYVALKGEGNRALSLTKDIDMGRPGLYGLNVTLSPPLGPGEAYSLTVSYVFSGLLEAQGADYIALFPKYPALTSDAVFCNVSITLPKGVSLQESSWVANDIYVDRYVEQPLPAFYNEMGYVTFYGTVNVLEFERMDREVIFDSMGSIRLRDSYKLRNIGNSIIRAMTIQLPTGASDPSARDSLGPIEIASRGGNGPPSVDVSFRYPLRGEPDYTAYSFTLEYQVPRDLYLEQTGLWEYRFRSELSAGVNSTIRDVSLRVVLPMGAELLAGDLLQSFRNITPLHSVSVGAEHRYIIFWAAFYPTLWVGLIMSVIGGYMFFSRARRPPTLPMMAEVVEALRAFIEVSSERMALELELESLEADLERRRVRKGEYDRRARRIKRQLSRLNRESAKLKQRLREAEPRYADAVSEMEVAEAEVGAMKEEIRRIESDYRAGRISRDACDKLRDTYRKRIDRSRSSIDGVLMRLRAEMR